jgi:N-acetyl-1-D-myo-inositol-2-amino-2-deoxy-alpha-D-glucopyranoside deacetylase
MSSHRRLPSPETPRLLFVHAHPDDETLTTGGTIAHYVAQGAQVHVVTCTLGEEGEVIGDRYRLLTADHADQLGGYRINELTQALHALGIEEPIHLGGPGRWRDSCMPAKPSGRQTRFVDAGDDAVRELAAVIDRLRPHVVVTYDPKGGYGHPDHVQAHRVTTAAVQASEWTTPKFYWTVLASSALRAGLNSLGDIPPSWTKVPNLADMGFCHPDSAIDAVIDVVNHLDCKLNALSAHATQVRLAPDRRCFALSNKVPVPILSQEHYVLAAGRSGPRDRRGWETDLLAGLSLR